MLETLLSLIGKGIITGAASKGGQTLIEKLKKYFEASLAEKIGDAYLKASNIYSELGRDEVIIDDSLEDDPYYKNLIYGFNIIDGSDLPDYHKQMNKLFLLELFKIPELANQVFNIKLDNIHKEVLDIKKDTRDLVQKFNLLEQEEAPEELLFNIEAASVDLSSYENTFQSKIHIDRLETTEIYNWILSNLKNKESNIALLVGNAGYGKSVVLKDLFVLLKEKRIPTLGIKVDKILNISSIKDIEAELNITNGIIPTFRRIGIDNELVVLLIDQIDALSQSLSSSRHAINSYDRLIKQLEVYPNIRIIISCRNYDLDYDPILRSYKEKKIFHMSLLEMQQVDSVLSTIGINIDERQTRLKEFLRIPLHLNLFCKVG
ncbi:ATP-binding protein [Dysgonomonas sp. HDW5A]|uniref:AAA family ATPase n=1 Tax=Dysgonomonas sp. HDW5A TaxID=2714926 RepID=UPI00140D5F21|nr:AAA family ATPase [Dysgonomonas sp. HDW5A]QIK58331.1 ATP-binding protein [Dysgonomonas sp. HDW5A]